MIWFFDVILSGNLILQCILATITFGLGVSLSWEQFSHIIKYPASLSLGLCIQMIVVPFIGLVFARIIPFDPLIKMGVFLITVSPGGPTSNILTFLFKGNIELSLLLSATNSLISLISLPLIVNRGLLIFLGQETSFTLPFWDTVFDISMITILPAIGGILFKQQWPKKALIIEMYLGKIALILLGLIMIHKFFVNEETKVSFISFFSLLIPMIGINILAVCTGAWCMRWAGFHHDKVVTLAIEAGLQNSVLALLITNIIGSQAMQPPILVYALTSFWITAGTSRWIAHYRKKNDNNVQ